MEVTEEDSPDEALKQFRFQVRDAQEGACVCDCAAGLKHGGPAVH